MDEGIVLAPNIDLSQEARTQGIRFCLRYPGETNSNVSNFFN
jgi:hypothetical protein